MAFSVEYSHHFWREHLMLSSGQNHVFLSFKSGDTRHGFTQLLYTFLSEEGVGTLRHDEEFRRGEEMGPEILKAIGESRISIPILSRNYASSKLCLMELAQMVECMREIGQVILPIFYDVTPEEVKCESDGSSYQDALKEHKESGNFSDQTIEQWNKALNEVAHLDGWNLKEDAYGYKGELIREKIGPEVLSELIKLGIELVDTAAFPSSSSSTSRSQLRTPTDTESDEDSATSESDGDTTTDIDSDEDISSKSPSKSRLRGKYQVFLSFRTPDTGSRFTDFLYTSLIESRVHTFREDQEFREGDEISDKLYNAIRQSRISIPIFSKNYAHSKWCLKELVMMVECFRHRHIRQLILPIFYDVTPEEVKDQSGSYGEAFNEHKRSGNFSDRTIQRWKKALEIVGQLEGWNLRTQCDGFEGRLVMELVVPKVVSVLKKKFINVTEDLVGMDHYKNEIMRLIMASDDVRMDHSEIETMRLIMAPDDVQIVGIHGMSGIGKTTVAKFIYNKLLENFDCCSFLADVQKMAKQLQGLVKLQNQLLFDTLKWSPVIPNVDNGIAVIKQKFHNKKVLIVLDDVNSISQFHCLVGECDCFGKGSMIIVTTKNKGVLNVLQVERTIELPFMNFEQSLQLLSKHAFHMDFPPNEYVSIFRKIASFSGGLPLALKYAGLSLSTSTERSQYALERSAETLNGVVSNKLKVDYKALNKRQQQIFLDIACLFVGMNKTTVFYMWDDCGYFPNIEFNDLCLMSIVKVGDANELWMHNQFIALGKKIVNDEKFSTRLWNRMEALNLLEEHVGTEQVQALSLGSELECEEKRCFSSDEFTRLLNLRYLQVDGADLVGDFKRLLLSLRWLSWRRCPPDFKPTNFCMKNLVILDISNSAITEEWGGWKQIQMAKKLKVLQVAGCALRRTPTFSSDAPLEILILASCRSLENIDPSIGHLTNLKVLDISHTNIWKLPDEIWLLKNLEVMDFTECSNLDPDFPSNMERLSSLRFLSFYGSKIQRLPASILRLTQLQTLSIGGCKKLELQPELPSSLRILNAGDIPDLTSMVNLQQFQLFECHNLVEMPRDIGKLFKLEKLTLYDIKIQSLPEDIGHLFQLKVLDIRSCEDLQCVLGLPSSLIEFSLANCDSLETLPDLTNFYLKNLSSLLLKNCDKLAQVQGLGKLESLTSLYIYACEMLATFENMPDLSNLKKLEILSISNCFELDKIQGLDGLESLRYLDLRYCENLGKIEGLESLKYLEVLDLLRCTSLESIPDLSHTYIQCPENEIDTVDSAEYRYWTELTDKKLLGLLEPPSPPLSGYRNEATQEELLKKW